MWGACSADKRAVAVGVALHPNAGARVSGADDAACGVMDVVKVGAVEIVSLATLRNATATSKGPGRRVANSTLR